MPISQVTQALGVYMGSEYVNDFDFNNRSYRVYVQADQPFRMNARDLRQYYVRSDTNGLVPLGNIVSLTGDFRTAGDQPLQFVSLGGNRRRRGTRLQFCQGSSRWRIWLSRTCCKACLSAGRGWRWKKSKPAARPSLFLASDLLVVYLTLSAQYESFALPFIILLAVPMAVLGALVFVSVRGLVDDVYVQIGLVMLIGLSAKNSILIVEFAEQLIDQGRSVINAAIEAAELRLRPILMTSFAFILGVLPLYFATGAGKLGRHSVGTAIVGGMLFSTILNLFFIPGAIRDCQRRPGFVVLKEGTSRTENATNSTGDNTGDSCIAQSHVIEYPSSISSHVDELAGATGLEPAASCVTGRRSNLSGPAPRM